MFTPAIAELFCTSPGLMCPVFRGVERGGQGRGRGQGRVPFKICDKFFITLRLGLLF